MLLFGNYLVFLSILNTIIQYIFDAKKFDVPLTNF